MIVPVPGCQPGGTLPDWAAWSGAVARAAVAVPDEPLPELELATANPPTASTTTAAPPATNLVSLGESMESTPVIRWMHRRLARRAGAPSGGGWEIPGRRGRVGQ